MKINTLNSFLAALTAAVLVTGCGSSGIGGVLGGGNDSGRTTDNGTYDPYGQRANELQGTVERVNARDRYVVLDVEASRYNLRNGNEGEVTLYYDDRTDVEFEGKTYQPQDLEPGDRIRAEIDNSGSRLLAEQIEVLHDATGGSSSTGVLGGYGDDRDDRDNDSNLSDDLRGTVRYIDTRDRTLEIEPSRNDSRFSTGSRSNVVVVHYDAQTVVEFQGQRYTPDNLEQGDEVEVDVRDSNGRLMAEEIVVVRDSRNSIGR
jgi:cold shock CspA family protein